jgi:hypothetical protein
MLGRHKGDHAPQQGDDNGARAHGLRVSRIGFQECLGSHGQGVRDAGCVVRWSAAFNQHVDAVGQQPCADGRIKLAEVRALIPASASMASMFERLVVLLSMGGWSFGSALAGEFLRLLGNSTVTEVPSDWSPERTEREFIREPASRHTNYAPLTSIIFNIGADVSIIQHGAGVFVG